METEAQQYLNEECHNLRDEVETHRKEQKSRSYRDEYFAKIKKNIKVAKSKVKGRTLIYDTGRTYTDAITKEVQRTNDRLAPAKKS